MAPEQRDEFDVVVVGSGFGGAMVAHELAGRMRVLVLERGRPYPPGSFPRSPRAFARDGLWAPQGSRHGLWEVLSFRGLDAIVSSGLGGGSLIYANVLLEKDPDTFAADGMVIEPDVLREHARAARRLLRGVRYPWAESTPKTRAVLDAAGELGLPAELPPIAVAFGRRPGDPLSGDNLHGVARRTCTLSGACFVGCNEGAKQTLDLTLLTAAERAGAAIRTCSEARTLRREDDGWVVGIRQHVAARAGHPERVLDPDRSPWREVRARRVVLAAGTFGTTRLLLANRAALPGLSRRLGAGFSSNGDLLMFLRGADRFLDPSRGPTITATIRVPDAQSPSGRELLVQDAGSPAGGEWLWQLLTETPGDLWRLRGRIARRLAARGRGGADSRVGELIASALGDTHASAAMVPLLGMGRDVPDGRMTLDGDALRLSWRERPSRSFFEGLEATGRRVGAALGGRVFRLGGRFARLVTVHPLGGCAMARDAEHGVVGSDGEVFGADGLYVADGSLLAGPVGPNPSLTISALARHVAHGLRDG
jgi:cholesterol oxidase